jgi:hypothetical protein
MESDTIGLGEYGLERRGRFGLEMEGNFGAVFGNLTANGCLIVFHRYY